MNRKYKYGGAAGIVAVLMVLLFWLPSMSDKDIYGGVHATPCHTKYENAQITLLDPSERIIGLSNLTIDSIHGPICIYKFQFLDMPQEEFYVLELLNHREIVNADQVSDGVVLFVGG